jgi:GNAT superfamily N-acetyltransferase
MQLHFDGTLRWWQLAGCLLVPLALWVRLAWVATRSQRWRASHLPHHALQSEDALPPILLQSLPSCRRRDAAILAAHAFRDSPAYVHILRGDKAFRLEALVWLFERNISLVQQASARADPTRCLTSPSGRLLCFFWLLPSTTTISLLAKVRQGLLWFPFLFGLGAFCRLLTMGDMFDKATASIVRNHILLEADRHAVLVLERMVVDPLLQGRGVGSACLRSALSTCAQKPVVLSTQLPRNVEFYGRLGFVVVHEELIGADNDEHRFRSWWMLRPAATTSIS